MLRCIICDHCSDNSSGFVWNSRRVGYECKTCLTEIATARFQLKDTDNDGEIREHWIDSEWDDVEGPEVLEVKHLERNTSDTTD